MPATLKDVARYAGCSVKTVSRVVNREPYVTPELRERVQAAVRAVGYAPNISARSLVKHKSFLVGILMYPGIPQTASNILTKMLDITYEEDYDILIQPYFPGHRRSWDKLVEMVTQQRVDGFVLTPPCDADSFALDLLTTYQVPMVLVDPVASSEAVPYVAGDNFHGALALTEYLLGLGHRRIGFFMGPRNLRASSDRFYGYRAALDARQVPFEAGWVENTEYTFDGGYTATRLLLERSPRVSAIFGGNDEAAMGALFALQELGLAVPGDVAVCGFENLPVSKQVWPGLTTMDQPAGEMIALAVQMLISILKKHPPEKTQVLFPFRLVVRGSTAPPGKPAADGI